MKIGILIPSTSNGRDWKTGKETYLYSITLKSFLLTYDNCSKIRKSINPNVKVRYAYYASDNPLETGSTLASGGLGTTGVKPTYLITIKILEQIFNIK